jgi:uncharacterized SAM-binding protein YcdF (DUF218 family)
LKDDNKDQRGVKRKLRYFLIPIVLVALVFLAQVIFFIYALSDSCQYTNADAVVVFGGNAGRIEKGYDLISNGYSKHLIISPAKPYELVNYDKRYDWKQDSKHIYETKARTTFENAVYIKLLIAEHHFKSVLLVTSTWHMPRSYFLLKTQLLFSGIKIYRVGSVCSSTGRLSWWESAKIRKLVYREFAKLWGSVGEYFIYLLNGKLPEKNLKEILIFKS